ncbi:MAG: hypothetical protein J6P61_04740 [Erysipelotrichaceae bacterium]|nr:hypothetical protein [Erysipelotrichaceae bacterium]
MVKMSHAEEVNWVLGASFCISEKTDRLRYQTSKTMVARPLRTFFYLSAASQEVLSYEKNVEWY